MRKVSVTGWSRTQSAQQRLQAQPVKLHDAQQPRAQKLTGCWMLAAERRAARHVARQWPSCDCLELNRRKAVACAVALRRRVKARLVRAFSRINNDFCRPEGLRLRLRKRESSRQRRGQRCVFQQSLHGVGCTEIFCDEYQAARLSISSSDKGLAITDITSCRRAPLR